MIEDTTIYAYRVKKKLSQRELADLMDLPRTTVSFFENKKMFPDLETAERMAKILDVTIGQLYSSKELAIILDN